MSTPVKSHSVGDCVQVTAWESDNEASFYDPVLKIGIILEAEYIAMDVMGTHAPIASLLPESETEISEGDWLYKVLCDSIVDDFWDYEVKLVNIKKEDYNIIVPQSHKEK